jgi:hypothetical protein
MGEALALALLLMVFQGIVHGQATRPAPRFGPPDSSTETVDPMLPMVDGTLDPNMRQLRMLNAARQKSMVSDAAKLLKLARQLDDEIAASHGSPLTPEQLRKIAKIEKLAHNVKMDMSTAVLGGMEIRRPFTQ